MSNITPDKMRGLVVPISTVSEQNIWTAQSTFSQKNPRAGIPAPAQDGTSLVLTCAGSQAETIKVTTKEGGVPGKTATFIWEGEDATELGKDHDNILTDFKYWKFSSSPGYEDFACIADSDGTLYSVSELINSGIYTISCHSQKQDGSITTLKTFFTGTLSSSPSSTAKPMITILNDGSILVAYFNYTNDNFVNIVVWRSFDNGSNWQNIAERALQDQSINVTAGSGRAIDKTTMIVSNDIVIIFISFHGLSGVGENDMVALISRDQGTTFTQSVPISNGYFHELVAVALPNGSIALSYLSATQDLKHVNIPHPGVQAGATEYLTAKQKTISSGTLTFCTQTATGSGSNFYLSGGNITSWFNEGYLYVVAEDTNKKMVGFLSADNGDTWQYIAGGFTPTLAEGTVYQPNSSTVHKGLKATVWEGRSIIMVGTNNSIALMYFGGFSSFSFPALVDQPDRFNYNNWKSTWIANNTPDTASVYSATGSGTGSVLSDGLRINTSSNTKFYTYSGNLSEAQYWRWKLKVTTGNDLTTHYIGMLKTSDDTSNSYEVNFRFGTAGFLIHDGTTVLSSVTQDMTSEVEFVCFHKKTALTVFYRVWDQKQAKKWTKLSLTVAAQATGAGNSLKWGHTASFTAQSSWSEFFVSESGTGAQNSTLRGSLYPQFGKFRYVDSGLLLTAREAPARATEEYKIKPRYDYSIDNIFYQVSLSTQIVWRSKDATANKIAFYIDPKVGSTARNLGLSDVLGIHLSNINWRKGKLQLWNGAAWVTAVTIDTSTGLQGTFQRVGSTLQPNSSATDFYLHYDECRNWRAELTSGDDTFIVKIVQNSEGVWGNQSTHKRSILVFDTSLTDPATLPTSGNIKLMPDKITIAHELLSSSGSPGEYAIALEVDSQTSLEGYHQIGSLVVGNVLFMAPQYQRGRNISYLPNTQSSESLDGLFQSRKLSDGRRIASIAWTEAVDTRSIMSISPDYWQYSTTAGSQPVANYGDAPFQMMGLIRYLANQTPIVYLPSLKKSTGSDDTQVFNRYHDQMLCRTTGDITIESVLGEEQKDELFRVATMNLEELE